MKLRIELKKKPCYGTTPETRGYGCGKLTYHRHYGLGKMCCYPKWLLETEAGRLKIEKAKIKACAPRKELEAMGKARKERKGLTTLLESVKQYCHRYIRQRDKGRPCISCGTPWHSDFEAGHYFKSELYSSLRFHELNIHGQCVRCNRMNEGNLSQYTANLPNRIGGDKFQVLCSIAAYEKLETKKWDREELKKIREYYKSKIKDLK